MEPLSQDKLERRAHDRRVAKALDPAVRMPLSFTESDKYRWLRANRHNPDIDQLLQAFCDSDFDAQIEAAMRMSVASPSYFGHFEDLPS